MFQKMDLVPGSNDYNHHLRITYKEDINEEVLNLLKKLTPMEKIYEISGHKLLVLFHEQIIQIKNPKSLKKFLSKDIELRSEILVNYIKQDYSNFIGKELAISNDSFIIEIWGHVFASHFAKAMKNLIRLKLMEKAADFIIKKSDVIDCGESGVDLNRKFWDILANFKKLIIVFLPKKIK